MYHPSRQQHMAGKQPASQYGQQSYGTEYAFDPSQHPQTYNPASEPHQQQHHQPTSDPSPYPLDDLTRRDNYAYSLAWTSPVPQQTGFHHDTRQHMGQVQSSSMGRHYEYTSVPSSSAGPSSMGAMSPPQPMTAPALASSSSAYFSPETVHQSIETRIPQHHLSTPMTEWATSDRGSPSSMHAPLYTSDLGYGGSESDPEGLAVSAPAAFATHFHASSPDVSMSTSDMSRSSSALLHRRAQLQSNRMRRSASYASGTSPKPYSLNGSRQVREQIPAEKWETHKATIRRLYLEERKPLKEVMKIMDERHDFHATPKMYKTRFSQWGFVKNNTEEEVKKLLSMKFERDANGKISEFIRNGKVVNINTYLKRKGVTEYDLVEFDSNSQIPTYVRCRTPTPPPAPGYLQSPDLVRAQETIVSNARKAFLQCRQVEVETQKEIRWTSIMTWEARSSNMLYEAGKLFEKGQTDRAGSMLMRAFKLLEGDLQNLSTQGIREVLMGMANPNSGMTTAMAKYLAAYSATNYDRTHPLRLIFSCLYEVQQRHGPAPLSELLWGCVPLIAEEIESIYGPRHPYVARTWLDLATLYDHTDLAKLERISSDLAIIADTVKSEHGEYSPDYFAFLYTRSQVLAKFAIGSQELDMVSREMWNLAIKAKIVFPVKDQPNTYCWHSVIQCEPWMVRLKERYRNALRDWEGMSGLKVIVHFAEEPHTVEHADEEAEEQGGGVYVDHEHCLS